MDAIFWEHYNLHTPLGLGRGLRFIWPLLMAETGRTENGRAYMTASPRTDS